MKHVGVAPFVTAVALTTAVALLFGGQTVAHGQTATAPKPAAKPAAAAPAKAASPVDKVIELVKAGLGEDMVVKAIGKDHLTADLSTDDMLKLKKAGATDKVIAAMEPAAEAPAPAPAPAAAPAASAADATPAAVPVSAASQRRVAIEEFDWAAVRSYVDEIFGRTVDIGKGIRSLLTTRVQQGGKVRVVERAKADVIMKEQDFGTSNRVKKGSNSRVGQILGADAFLMGDIVTFGRDDKKKGIGIPLIGAGRSAVGIRLGKSEDKAVIVINYRIVDAETSEVIDSGEARGESVRKGKSFGGALFTGGAAGGAMVDMTSSNFANTIIGEATIDACNKLADILNAKAAAMKLKQVDVEARVADVTGSSVTIVAGSDDGVLVGDQFDVFRIVSEIKDPVTGEVLDQKVERLGTMTISDVRPRVSSGTYSGRAVTAKDGLARKKML